MDSRERTARAELLLKRASSGSWSDIDQSSLDRVCERLQHRDAWKDKFSLKDVEDGLLKIVYRLMEEGGTLSEAELQYEQFVTKYDTYAVEQVIYVPLFGIQISPEPCEIGMVRIIAMTQIVIDSLLENVTSVITQTRSQEDVKTAIIQRFQSDLQGFLGSVCAEFRHIGGPNKAYERALEETHRAMDLLRYSMPGLYGHAAKYMAVGLFGEISKSTRTIIRISFPMDQVGLNMHTVGPVMSFEITPENVTHMNEIGFSRLSQLLRQEGDISELENILLHAVHWFANAQLELANEYKLLSLVICLETFLSNKADDKVTNTIAEGVAIIVGDTLAERLEIKQRIKALYGKRSDISHGRTAKEYSVPRKLDHETARFKVRCGHEEAQWTA